MATDPHPGRPGPTNPSATSGSLGAYTSPGGPVSRSAALGTLPTGNTTTWDLAEFTTHRKRLEQVAQTVDANIHRADEARDDNGDAYGVLFGWIVSPALHRVCDRSAEFTTQLKKAMDASSEAIKATQGAYSDTEQSNEAATATVDRATREAIRTVRG